MSYVGRFAPSPTGPLHVGSLLTAVASYLHARQAGGQWLVRIEDIDPPREVPGSAADILRTLEAFALEWDGAVLHQSTRLSAYAAAAEQLIQLGIAFRCDCTRSRLRTAHTASQGRYPGTCRNKRLTNRDTAVRVRVDGPPIEFVDGLQGAVRIDLREATGDYVICRRDGLMAYHLAVVVDDAAQGVTTVVRGIDLLDSTAVHQHLQAALGLRTPRYFHLPVVVNAAGQKLSKQTGAAAVVCDRNVAADILTLLGAEVPAELRGAPPREAWLWARDNWTLEKLRARRSLVAPAV